MPFQRDEDNRVSRQDEEYRRSNCWILHNRLKFYRRNDLPALSVETGFRRQSRSGRSGVELAGGLVAVAVWDAVVVGLEDGVRLRVRVGAGEAVWVGRGVLVGIGVAAAVIEGSARLVAR